MVNAAKRHFWVWFAQHNHEYLELANKSKKEATYLFKELDIHIKSCCRYFTFNIFLPDSGNARLCISVQGKQNHFHKVDKFIATAPDLPGWDFCALEDPLPIDLQLESLISKTGIHPSEFKFCIWDNEPNGKHIEVFHPLVRRENEKVVTELAYQAIYNLLGERIFAMEIKEVKVINLSLAECEEELIPLEEIVEHIGSTGPNMVVDENGVLVVYS